MGFISKYITGDPKAIAEYQAAQDKVESHTEDTEEFWEDCQEAARLEKNVPFIRRR